jgi:hypothetical protein
LSEVVEYLVGIHATLDYLDRYILLKLAIRANRSIYSAHPPGGPALHDAIGPDHLADQIVFRLDGC